MPSTWSRLATSELLQSSAPRPQSTVTLRRGFKAEAEREAARVRKELGLASHDRLDSRDLAKHLGIAIVDASDLVDIAELEELERLQAFRLLCRDVRGEGSSSSVRCGMPVVRTATSLTN